MSRHVFAWHIYAYLNKRMYRDAPIVWFTVVSLQSRFATSRFATLEVLSLQPDNLSEFIQVKQSTKMAARKQCLLVSNYHVNRHAVAPTCDFFLKL